MLKIILLLLIIFYLYRSNREYYGVNNSANILNIDKLVDRIINPIDHSLINKDKPNQSLQYKIQHQINRNNIQSNFEHSPTTSHIYRPRLTSPGIVNIFTHLSGETVPARVPTPVIKTKIISKDEVKSKVKNAILAGLKEAKTEALASKEFKDHIIELNKEFKVHIIEEKTSNKPGREQHHHNVLNQDTQLLDILTTTLKSIVILSPLALPETVSLIQGTTKIYKMYKVYEKYKEKIDNLDPETYLDNRINNKIHKKLDKIFENDSDLTKNKIEDIITNLKNKIRSDVKNYYEKHNKAAGATTNTKTSTADKPLMVKHSADKPSTKAHPAKAHSTDILSMVTPPTTTPPTDIPPTATPPTKAHPTCKHQSDNIYNYCNSMDKQPIFDPIKNKNILPYQHLKNYKTACCDKTLCEKERGCKCNADKTKWSPISHKCKYNKI